MLSKIILYQGGKFVRATMHAEKIAKSELQYQQKRDRRRTPKWEQCHRTLTRVAWRTRLRATNVNVQCVLYLL